MKTKIKYEAAAIGDTVEVLSAKGIPLRGRIISIPEFGVQFTEFGTGNIIWSCRDVWKVEVCASCGNLEVEEEAGLCDLCLFHQEAFPIKWFGKTVVDAEGREGVVCYSILTSTNWCNPKAVSKWLLEAKPKEGGPYWDVKAPWREVEEFP